MGTVSINAGSPDVGLMGRGLDLDGSLWLMELSPVYPMAATRPVKFFSPSGSTQRRRRGVNAIRTEKNIKPQRRLCVLELGPNLVLSLPNLRHTTPSLDLNRIGMFLNTCLEKAPYEMLPSDPASPNRSPDVGHTLPRAEGDVAEAVVEGDGVLGETASRAERVEVAHG